MYNQLAETFSSQATVKFVVLLWGEKSSITREGEGLPIYCYREIINLGHESHTALLSQGTSKCILIVHSNIICLLTSDGYSIFVNFHSFIL
jgi:long-chain acyl-CoA synthetase